MYSSEHGGTPLDHTRLAAARLRAADHYPFLAGALYALVPISTPGLGTFAVDDRWRLFIDPDTLDAWPIEQVATVLLHEVGHVVRDHAGRARELGVDPTTAWLWNLAGDAEINDDLIADRLEFPAKPVTPATLKLPDHRAAEFYFTELMRGDPPRAPVVDCGSGAHGCGPHTLRSTADLPAGLDVIEQGLVRRQVAVEIVALRGRRAGQGAAGWERWAEATLRPVVDWRRMLRAAVRSGIASRSGLSDYTYRRPSRRRIPSVVLPALQQAQPAIAVVVDTSGSVSEELLDAAWTEVLGVLKSIGARRELLTVWAADTKAIRINGSLGRRAPLIGGGGTDMAEALATAFAAHPQPAIAVVLTDGWTPWPSDPPPGRVIIAILGGTEGTPEAPPWARVVLVPTDVP